MVASRPSTIPSAIVFTASSLGVCSWPSSPWWPTRGSCWRLWRRPRPSAGTLSRLPLRRRTPSIDMWRPTSPDVGSTSIQRTAELRLFVYFSTLAIPTLSGAGCGRRMTLGRPGRTGADASESPLATVFADDAMIGPTLRGFVDENGPILSGALGGSVGHRETSSRQGPAGAQAGHLPR